MGLSLDGVARVMGILILTGSVQVSYRTRSAPCDILNLFKSLKKLRFLHSRKIPHKGDFLRE